MTFYGVNCFPKDVQQLPLNVRFAAQHLNKAFQQVGVIFKVNHEILPCNGRSGEFNMSKPTGEQIVKFADKEIRDRSKFSILTTWGQDTPAGFHHFPGTWGWFIFDGLRSESLGPHELGHGFGLPHTFTRTHREDGFRGCECAENMNTPNAETGDLCEDTPGIPLYWGNERVVPRDRVSNGCPKLEEFWNNPVDNFMRYGGYPKLFSPCQIKRMRCTWENNLKRIVRGYVNSDEITCFGKRASDPTSCSSKGVCVENDKCQCYPNANGNNCEN